MNKSGRNNNPLSAGFDQNILERGITMKKILQYIVLLFIIGFGFTSCGGNIAKVKKSVSVFNEGRTLSVAMDNNPYLKGGKYSAYKSTTGYDIVKYEKVFKNEAEFAAYSPQYSSYNFYYPEATLSVDNLNIGVINFMTFMNTFGPRVIDGRRDDNSYSAYKRVFVAPDEDALQDVFSFASSLYDSFIWEKSRYSYDPTHYYDWPDPFLYNHFFISNYDESKFYSSVVNRLYKIDPNTCGILQRRIIWGRAAYTDDETVSYDDALLKVYNKQTAETTISDEEIGKFLDLFNTARTVYNTQVLRDPHAFRKPLEEMKAGGKWMAESYEGFPEYLQFKSATVNFYFYIDQTTKEPGVVGVDESVTYKVAIPDVYTGDIEVQHMDVSGQTEEDEYIFYALWRGGRNAL
jgi:hypothetical protein